MSFRLYSLAYTLRESFSKRSAFTIMARVSAIFSRDTRIVSRISLSNFADSEQYRAYPSRASVTAGFIGCSIGSIGDSRFSFAGFTLVQIFHLFRTVLDFDE